MKGSLDLGRVAGIKVKVHWTFLLLIAWVVFLEVSRGSDMQGIFWSIIFVLVLFVCIVLHELGHALTARRYGVGTSKITLLPIGGVASLEEMPEEPTQEFMVAVAGPLVNVGIAVLLYFVVPLESYLNMSPEELQQTLSAINPENFLFYLLSANIMLVVFNVIPAFPMDGGRILRALLSMKLDRVRATQIASGMGQMVALFFFFIGLFYNPLLILIALFVFFGAQGENRMVQQLTLLRDHRVREAMMTDITVLKPDTTLDQVIDVILSGTERNFVVAEEDEVKGIVYQEELVKAIRERDRDTEIREVMNRDFEIVNHDEPLTDVYRRVSSLSTSFFPVKKNGELAGAIDMENINEFISLRASLDY